MCDCFHLAFPNWHAPAAGAGRRLRGPEHGAEDDSVCEEPEILEQERPRPQGSSPVEEFPVEKQVDEDISNLAHKTGSNKKSKKAGFGSLFDKRTSDKMDETENMQSGESDIIVKTVKEACVEGLVVTGGGREGIFIKELKQDSPASKHLSVKEGDQILSATVYFDNVSYEDALQILEHAQPYKMEFCLRRKVEPSIPENTEIILPKEKVQGSPVMRSERKMKKQQERISWPKFPSFGKGPRVQFKRSHSTSEAEEHRKLEMSPPTSDTDSPLKSPLKSPDGKDKKKKHKVQLKMKMKGHRSKSVEEPQNTENLMVWENQKVEDILEENVPEGHKEKMQGIPQVLDGAEYEASSQTGDNDQFHSLSGMGLHESHLISLGNTLKTTDISVALAEGGNFESSEMKVKIDQKGEPDIGTEALYITSDPSVYDDNVVLSKTKLELSQLDNDFNRQGKDSLEKTILSENTEHSMPNVDICAGETKKSPRIENEKQLKERSVFENQSYGIRTRGPLADMATSKTHFVSTVNGIQFISPNVSEITQIGKMSDGISDAKKQTVIFQTEPGSSIFAADKKDSSLEIKASKLSTETTDFIQADLDKRSVSKFKLPKVDDPGFITYELTKMTDVDKIKPHLPKREDIEIPGMETKETKPSLQTPEIRISKIEKIINITKRKDIQKPNEDFNVEDVKVAVSKFPAFKLPEGDITGVLVQREITIMELKSDKSVLTPRGSPHKTSIKSIDSNISVPQSKVGEEKSPTSDPAYKYPAFATIPMVELPYIDEQTSIAVTKTDYTEPQTADFRRFEEINFKLPKREDIEIPGMEAIKESKLQSTVVSEVIDANLDQPEKLKTKKYSDKKSHDKKSKKPKITIQAAEIAKPDNLSTDINTELPKKDSFKMETGETNIHERHKFKTPKIGEVENIDFTVQEAKILEDNMDNVDLPQKTETKFGKNKFKIPSIALPEFGTKVPKGAVDISAVDMQVKEPETILPKDKLKLSVEPLLSDLDGTDVNNDGQSISVYARAQDPETEGQGKKFKLPKFEISFPEVKAPKIICTSKKDDDSSVSEESGEVPIVLAPKAELPDVKPEVSADLPHIHSEIAEVKMKRPGFSFPRFGTSKSGHTAPAADVSQANVNISLPKEDTEMEAPNTNIAISVKDGKQKDATKFGSPTKFKIPSIKFPHFGAKVTKAAIETSDLDVNVKGAQISLPDTEVNLSAETTLYDTKDVDKKKKNMELIKMDIQSQAQGTKVNLPKFNISPSGLKKTNKDISLNQAEIKISVPKEKVQVTAPDIEMQAGIPEMKLNLPVDLDTAVEISSVNVGVKTSEVSLTDAKIELSAEPLLDEINGSDINSVMGLGVEMKEKDIKIEGQESMFKLPDAGISLSEVKIPKFHSSSDKSGIDFSMPEAKVEVYPPDFKVHGVTAELKADLPEVESKDFEVKMKTPGFSFPKIGFSKSEVKAPESDVSLPNVDLSLAEGSVEMERTTTDVTISMEDAQQKVQSTFGSPTKFKLPSINFPKFGAKVPKFTVEASDMHVDVKGPEISAPDAEIKLSAEPISMDIKGPDADKEMKPLATEIKGYDIHIKEQESKFKLPGFGINLPETKGLKFDATSDKSEIDISVPKATVEMLPPDIGMQGATAEIKADLPEVESKDIEVKMKTPGFSFPKIGLTTSEVTGPDIDVSLPHVDVSLPKGSIEMERPTADVTISMEDADQKDRSKFGSPTKFKLPSINFPKFGTKVRKVTVEPSGVDVDVKGPEICLPDAEIKLAAETIPVNIKGPDADIEILPLATEMKGHDIQIKEQGSKFKLPKFGISLPEIKGPQFDASSEKAEMDISGPKATVEMHLPDVGVQGITAEIKADLPEVKSKDIEVKMKTPGFSFPEIGFGKSEVTAPEGEVRLPNVNVSLPEGSLEMERPTADVAISVDNAEQKGQSAFGSPTKFKLPSINFPKIGGKVPKVAVEVSDLDVAVKGPEIGLPDAEIKLPSKTISVDIQGPDADIEMKPLATEAKYRDTLSKEQGSKFKLPKFGINLPEIKGPQLDVSSDKAEIDISVPQAIVEVHPPDIEVQGVTSEIKANLRELESKNVEVKMKTPGFSFPKLGFSKSEIKAPKGEVSLPNVDICSAEGSIEMERPTADVTISMEDTEQKVQSTIGSPTNFKLPSVNFPKFQTKVPNISVKSSDVDIDVKRPEISLPDAEMTLSAETMSVNIKGPNSDIAIKSPSTEIKDCDVHIQEQRSKFKLSKFGIGLPEIKIPKFDGSSDKAEIDVSVPKATVEMLPPDVEMQGATAEIKADLPELKSKDIEVKMKTPGFSFPKIGLTKSEVTGPDVDVSLPNVDVSLPKGSIEMERPTADVTISVEDAEQKGRSKFGSPTKFKLPSISFPKFGTKVPKVAVEVSAVNVDVKGPEISLPDEKMKLSAEPVSVNIKGPDADIITKPFTSEIKGLDIHIKEQESKFKLPKFGIGLPETKGPKFDASLDKAEIDISVPKATVEMLPPDVEMQGVKAEIKADLPEVESKDIEVKMKTPGFSFPKIGLTKSEVTGPDVDVSLPHVDVSLLKGGIDMEGPAADVTMEDPKQKDRSKFGSPTKFKLPSINFPKFGTKVPKVAVEVSDVDIDVKGPEISLPDAEMKLSAEPITVNMKGPDADIEISSPSKEIKSHDIQMKEQESKFKLPKFGISLPEIKGPKLDASSNKAEIDISGPKATVQMHTPDVGVHGVTAEIKAGLPEVESKGTDVKMKTPGISFPKIGFSKSEVKAAKGDVSFPHVDVSLPEGSEQMERPTADVTISVEDGEQKDRSKFGSPTKFKLPSINFPKFGTRVPKVAVEASDMHVDVKGPEISAPDAEIKLSAEPISMDIKGPDANKEMKPLATETKGYDVHIKEQESKFKLPKFGISLPEIKGPKFDAGLDKAEIDISVPKARVEMLPPDVEMQGATAEIKADLPELKSKDIEVKMKTPGFSFPKIGLTKSEVTGPDVDVSLPNVDVSLPKGSIEMERPTADDTISVEDAEQKGQSKFGSPTKFKLPSISFPRFGTKVPKVAVEVSDVNVDVKGPEISLPDEKMKLSAEPVSVNIKGPDADIITKPFTSEIKGLDIHIKEQESKFKLPKFGIGLPETKGPKFDASLDKAEIDISVPKATVEMLPPDVEMQGVKAEIKADLPEVESKDIEVKMKTPGFSFPKIGLTKSEVTGPDVDVSLPHVDVSLLKGGIDMEGPAADVTMEDPKQKDRSKFGSPTKFKLPSINFPKFGTRVPKVAVEASDMHVDVKGPEISAPDAEKKLSAEPISMDIKGPDANKEMKPLATETKGYDVHIKEQESKFKLPKFGISLPEIKGPKFDAGLDKAEIDISVPKARVEMLPPDIEIQGATAEIKADLPELKSKDIEVKMKTPGFSFPKTGLTESEVTGPDVEVRLPNVDVSLPKGIVGMEKPAADVTMEDPKQKDRSKFGSPTKFKLPSINFPKFGIKVPKVAVEVSDVDIDVKGPEISLPDAEMKLSAEPITVNMKGPDADIEMTSPSTEIKSHDIQIKEQGSKFKLPKFGISRPEIKGPKLDASSNKAEIDISRPKETVGMHQHNIEVQGVTAEIKANLPDVESKNIEVKMKTPGFSFPKIGFSKTQVKAPEVDASFPNVDVSLPEGSTEMDRPTTDVTISVDDAEQKSRSKFGSPTKFKLPSLNFPKFGTKGPKASVELCDVDIDVKGPEISLPDAEIQLAAETLTVDIKGPDADKEMKPLRTETDVHDIQMKDKGSKFQLPEFGIRLPEMNTPKFDDGSQKAAIDISVPKATVEVHPPEVQRVTAEMRANQPEVESEDIKVKMKTPGFSFPKIKFSKSDVTSTKGDVSLPNVDMSLSKGSIEIEKPITGVTMESMEDAEQKGQSKFGSPKRFTLSSINLPKFGTKRFAVEVSDVDVDVKGPEISLPDSDAKLSAKPISVDIKGPDADIKMKPLTAEMKGHDISIKEQGSKFKLPKFGISLPEVEGSKLEAKVKVNPPDTEVQEVTADLRANLPESKSNVPASELQVSLQTAVSLPEESFEIEGPAAHIIESVDIAGQKDPTKSKPQPKLKLTPIKLPKFGIQKETVEISSKVTVVKGPEISLPDADLSTESLLMDIKGLDVNKDDNFGVRGPQINIISKRSSKAETKKEVNIQTLDGKVTNLKNNSDVAISELDSQMGKCQNSALNDKTQGATSSSKYILPTLGDIFSGFEVEFNVPTFNEIEEAKQQYPDSPKDKDNIATKTAEDNENFFFQSTKKVRSAQSELNDKSKKSFTRETDEDSVSPTLSLSSSDAFADISSALSTEQTGLSLASPTKVKVKYSEPTANAELSDISEIHGNIITSTTRTELISMEPHQPEKVNIPFYSETSSSSVDTLKEMSGHIVVSSVQSVSKTEHAAILTEADIQHIQTLPLEKVTDSLSAEETMMRKGHTIVEKHVVKEIFGDEKEKIFVTQRIQVFEGESTEPISDDTASSIQKLRDTVHTEKIRFFEGAESSKTVLMSTETLLRHVDSSTDENEGK